MTMDPHAIEPWALRAMLRWPDVPALFDWLELDARGRWLLRGEPITRPQIIETIGRNYAPDAQGRWFFQNGPQRGYVRLAAAPYVLRVADQGEALVTHNRLPVTAVRGAFLDEHGALLLDADPGPGLLLDSDLPWALERLEREGRAIDEATLEATLQLASEEDTGLRLRLATGFVPVQRLDAAQAPQRFGYVCVPQPDGSRPH